MAHSSKLSPLVVAAWLACPLVLADPTAAAAQEPPGLSFQATLDSIKLNALPGQVVTRQFRLTLDANQSATRFKAHVEDWWQSDDGQQSFYGDPGTLQRSCAKWVTLNPVEATVEPAGTLVVRLSIALPRELAPGGFWCALTVDEIPDPRRIPPEGVGVRFAASVSAGIFVYVEPVQRLATIRDIHIESDMTRIRLRNDGNCPLGVEGRVEWFARGASSPIATVTLPRSTVLTEPSPDAVLTLPLPPAETLPSGAYRARVILDFGGDHYIGAEREVTITRSIKASDPDR